MGEWGKFNIKNLTLAETSKSKQLTDCKKINEISIDEGGRMENVQHQNLG